MHPYQFSNICLTGCQDGLWGTKCSKICFCKDGVGCNFIIGTCPNGCAPGNTGTNCNQFQGETLRVQLYDIDALDLEHEVKKGVKFHLHHQQKRNKYYDGNYIIPNSKKCMICYTQCQPN